MILRMNTDYFPKLHLLVGVILDEEFVVCVISTVFVVIIYVYIIFEGLMCGTRTIWRRMFWWKSGKSSLDLRRWLIIWLGPGGSVVVKALRYYSDGPGIDSRWFHWIFQ